MNLESLPTTQLSYWVEWVKWSELLIWKFWQQLTCSPRHIFINSQIRILNVHTFLESSYCFVKSNKKWTNKTYLEWLILPIRENSKLRNRVCFSWTHWFPITNFNYFLQRYRPIKCWSICCFHPSQSESSKNLWKFEILIWEFVKVCRGLQVNCCQNSHINNSL